MRSLALICLLLVSPTFAEEIGKSSFVLVPKAKPGKVDGHVHYAVFRSTNRSLKPIKNCLLQHGYGITPDALSRLTTSTHLSTFLPPPQTTFAYIYFGEEIIRQLLNKACENVFVSLQESNETTVLELTERTELFLKERVCTTDTTKNQKGCALVGHSMGGAAAFSIARRCMQKTSQLGQQGCQRLGSIYSATGVIQGAGASALVYGAKLNKDAGIKGGADLLSQLNKILPGALIRAGAFAWDLDSDKTAETNPTWFSLSPTAPMENNRPLYLANDVVLEKKNWLVADFAASATDYRFSGALDDELGCGTRSPAPTEARSRLRWEAQRIFCEGFGRSLGLLHSKFNRDAFDLGVYKLKVISGKYNDLQAEGGSTAYLDKALSWDQFQVSDGLADYALALGACERGLGVHNSAVTRCTTLRDINHQASAGGAKEAYEDIVAHLSTAAKEL